MTTQRADAAIYTGLILLTVLVHLHVNVDVSNDHAAYLAMGRQVLHGDWPIRDFRDDGSLLQVLLSAAAQRASGYTLLGEMLMSWGFLAAAACLTYRLGQRISGSRMAAAAAAVLAVLLVPRPYAYPKIFIYPLALLALWRYIEQPTTRRVAAMGAVTALAFLFRIDHGVVVALSSLIAIGCTHLRQPRPLARATARFAGWSALFSLPQIAYVTWAVGPIRYIESILTFGSFARAEREQWPTMALGGPPEENASAFLLYAFAGIVVAAGALAAARARDGWNRPGSQVTPLQVLVAVAMWLLMLPMLARGEYYTRIAEIGQPVAVLGAWLWMAAPRAGRRPVHTAFATVLMLLIGIAIARREPMFSFFSRSEQVLEGAPLQVEQFEAWLKPPIDSYASAEIEGPRWISRYALDCTRPPDRLLVTWYGPEIYFFSERAFAGDRWLYFPFDNSRERQLAVVERLRGQSVPLVFMDLDDYEAFRESWRLLAEYVDEAYETAADVTIGPNPVTRVLRHKDRIPSRHIAFHNLPCFD